VLNQLKRLSACIPKNGEVRFSSSIARRKWVDSMSGGTSQPGQTSRQMNFRDTEKHPGTDQNMQEPAFRHLDAGGQLQGENSEGTKRRARRIEELRSKGNFFLTILNSFASNCGRNPGNSGKSVYSSEFVPDRRQPSQFSVTTEGSPRVFRSLGSDGQVEAPEDMRPGPRLSAVASGIGSPASCLTEREAIERRNAHRNNLKRKVT
jgi:hypothetical protein